MHVEFFLLHVAVMILLSLRHHTHVRKIKNRFVFHHLSRVHAFVKKYFALRAQKKNAAKKFLCSYTKNYTQYIVDVHFLRYTY